MSRALILMYHSIDEPLSAVEARYCVRPSAFADQMAWLAHSSHNLVPLAAVVDAIRMARPLPENAVAVTFDDGFECFARNALPVLTKFGVPATLFAVAGLVGKTNDWMTAKGWPERRLMGATELRAVQAAGIDIGCHGLRHMPMTGVSDAILTEETTLARQVLGETIGSEVSLFAYPHGAQGPREREAVAAAGFTAACSTLPGYNRCDTDRFALRRIDVFGTDALPQFKRKVVFGANRVGLGDLARYYSQRIRARIYG